MRARWLKIVLATALLAGGVTTASLPAQASAQTDFIAKLVPGARENERKTGIPASVTIGMAALESGWGKSRMATTMTGSYTADGKTYKVNTLFNIKCGSTASPYQSGCVPVKVNEYTSGGVEYYTVAKFRTYSSWTNSMLDYGRLLTSSTRYAAAFDYKRYPDQFVTEVRKGGYATDPSYATKVIGIMGSYNLYQYNVNGGKAGYPWTAPQTAKTYPTVKSGDSGATVKTLQRLLNYRGGTSIAVDGSFGTGTRNAVKQYQAMKHLSVDGIAGDQTWASLLGTVKSGNTGTLVGIAQYALKDEGYKLTVTKKFDAATVAAAKAFQKAKGITVDGIIGTGTWSRLLKTTSALTSPPTTTPPSPAPTYKYPTLKSGSTGTTVKTAQRLLNARAGAKLSIDGYYGSATKAAVTKFQKAKGISATGTLGATTWAKLVPSLKKGSSGYRVKALQYELGYSGYSVSATGTFNQATVDALKKYQRAKSISATGATGPKTWASLMSSNKAVDTYPELARGAKGNDVKTLQRLLNARAGAKVSVDGILGSGTQSAIKAYQAKLGLKATGVADNQTWLALTPTLKTTSTNTGAIKALQYELRYSKYTLSATGKYDKPTVSAVKKFQQAKKMTVNGATTDTLWKKILG